MASVAEILLCSLPCPTLSHPAEQPSQILQVLCYGQPIFSGGFLGMVNLERILRCRLFLTAARAELASSPLLLREEDQDQVGSKRQHLNMYFSFSSVYEKYMKKQQLVWLIWNRDRDSALCQHFVGHNGSSGRGNLGSK